MVWRIFGRFATVVSAVLFVGVCAAWVAGCWSRYPFEVRRLGIDYSPASGGDLWSVHAGAHDGAVYVSENHIEPRLRKAPWLISMMKKLSGTRERHVGRVDNVGDEGQPLLNYLNDTRCVPPQTGDLLAPDWRLTGFRAFKFWSGGSIGVAVVVPCWFLMMLTAAAPGLWLRRALRRRASDKVG